MDERARGAGAGVRREPPIYLFLPQSCTCIYNRPLRADMRLPLSAKTGHCTGPNAIQPNAGVLHYGSLSCVTLEILPR